MEGPGAPAAEPSRLAGLAGKALERTGTWYYTGATLLFYAYPFVVLAWTALEGAAAARGREPAVGGKVFRCCQCRRGRRGGKDAAENLKSECGVDGEGAVSPPGEAPAPPRSASIGLLGGATSLASALASGARYLAVLLVLALRLVVYSLLLAPWFLQIGYAYFHNPRIRRGVRYGSNPRNYVDIYFPTDAMAAAEREGAGPTVPIVVTVMGGAWIIGHRLWNVLLGMRLSQAGVLVVGVDYRNWPGGEMHEMVEDIGSALDWVFANAGRYHGDTKQVVLIGQSAGAHLEAMVLLERCMAEARGGAGSRGWSPSDLKGFFGVSGPYDLVALQPHLASRGIYNALPHLCARRDVARYSPMHVLATPEWKAVAAKAAAKMPPVHLYAGELDKSVPSALSAAFASALRGAGAAHVTFELGKGVRHAQPVVEDPLTGGDLQIKLMLPLLPKDIASRIESLPPPYPQVPKLLAGLTLRLMPF